MKLFIPVPYVFIQSVSLEEAIDLFNNWYGSRLIFFIALAGLGWRAPDLLE